MKKKIAAMTIVLSLIFTMVLGSIQVKAAGADDVAITGLVSDSATSQLFKLDNLTGNKLEIQWQTEHTGWNPLTIEAGGSKTVTCSDPNMAGVTLTVFCDGEVKSLRSLNSYRVSVTYYDENGGVLGTDSCFNNLNGGGSYTAPTSLNVNGETYLISGPEYKEFSYKSNVQSISYQYNLQRKPDVTCGIVFVDQFGTQIGSDSLTVAPGATGSFTPPQSVTGVNGRTYTLAAGQQAISHHYNQGEKDYVYHYQLVAEDAGRPYLVRVLYQTSDGTALAANSMTVQSGTTATFQVASEYMAPSGVLYGLAAGQPSVISHSYADTARVYTVVYDQAQASAPYDISIRYIDARSGGIVKSNSVRVEMDAAAVFNAEASFSANNTEYYLAPGQAGQVVHSFGDAKRVYNVYYNEKGSMVERYPVTVRYFDVTAGEVLYSTTLTADINNNGLAIDVPSDYAADGENYVLLGGQSNSVNHEFYSTRRAYVFFFRNVNDTLNENTNVETTPEGNQVVITPNQDMFQTTPEGDIDIPDVPIPLGPGPDEENSSSSSSSASSSGSSSSGGDVTIDDNEVPLASGPLSDHSQGSAGYTVWWICGGAAVLLAAGAAVALVLIKRNRKKKQDGAK